MKTKDMHRNDTTSLWRWICKRLISLAVGSIIIIAFLMWVRFYVENKWHEYRMPEDVRAELSVLIKHPEQNITRYHEIIDTWYGIAYSDPRMGVVDWMILGVLVLIFIPVIFWLTLRTARPVSLHISRLAHAARAVSEGGFGTKVPVPDTLPLELRSLSENFNGMSMQLERYEKDLKKSHVIMAHELRSPLTAAIGRLQGVIDGVFEPSETQLGMIMRQLNELNRLVDDLHLLKLADAAQLNLTLIPTDLGKIIREKVAWITPSANKSSVNITCHGAPGVTCMADPYRIGQVFLILMDNALKYAADGGILDISYEITEKDVSVVFRDHGPAVSDEFLEDIFTPFVREDLSRTRHSGGSGLGLSIARAICHAHGGNIAVEKNRNRGLTFRVTLLRN
ncbi:HAMP domain-containing sensor histidine kinase [Enterobacter sp. DTU_2021_1002640_1_SI_PRY_ASU_LCPMC_013]|uniref:sensor histidine kinase n=1 Tax=Enterobacter sp. DTU_2021_1002640_1_SI_PRY_ASU_LCPMC_013 TaxID=3077940 RepID=UPI0028F05CB1|nr:HAMP domain-containing sensor histidine kinase [Enterobacter sp. DTU_2021_1002640_1_SI_PRY_ASU_LCPMC_013]WNU99165.1 HAMP domain-containing sensor histidine kinase [Enterobacter sp. DTU_2021_1002640_1_SI_PRY_ASU_LCPMC_013]